MHSLIQGDGLLTGHVWLWQLNRKECRMQKIDAFELWCWKRLLKVPWTAGRSKQSILREINPEYSLEGLMLKLKLQYLGYLMKKTTHWKSPWCWERLKAELRRASEDEMAGWHHQYNGHELEQTTGDGERQGGLACCIPWCLKVLDVSRRLNNNNNVKQICYGNSQFAVSWEFTEGIIPFIQWIFIEYFIRQKLC